MSMTLMASSCEAAQEPRSPQPAASSSSSATAGSNHDDVCDFFMYKFKVVACPDTEAHDVQDCPFAHPAEKATRRDPRVHLYTGVSCPSYRKGSCKDGDACRYAHGVFEVWLHPSRFRTELCKDGPSCTRKCCFFAHTPEELRQPTPQDPSLPVPASKKTTSKPNSSSLSSSSAGDIPSQVSEGTVVNSSRVPSAQWGGSQVPLCMPLASSSVAPQAPPRSLTPAQALQLASLADASSSAAKMLAQQPFGRSLSGLAEPAAAADPSHNLAAAVLLHSVQQQQQQQHQFAASTGGAGGGNRMLCVPLEIAAEAALVAAAAGTHSQQLPALQQQQQLPMSSSPFHGLDHMTALVAASAALSGEPLACHNLPAGLDLTAAALTQPLASGMHSASLAASAAAAFQLISEQQQDLMTAALLQQALASQQQLPDHQQQQQQQGRLLAMWSAAYDAAKGVGLQPHEAAACADCAVKQATAGQPVMPAHMTTLVGSHKGLDAKAAPGHTQLLLPEQPGHLQALQSTAALQQQQQAAALALMLNSTNIQPAHISHKLTDYDTAVGCVGSLFTHLRV